MGKLTNAVNPFKAQSQGFGGRMRQQRPTMAPPPPKIQPGRRMAPPPRPQPQMAQQPQMASQLRRPMMGRRR